MKIAQVTFNFPPEIGGIGQYVWNLSRLLAQNGAKVTVLAPVLMNSPSQERLAGFNVYRVGALRFPFLDILPLNIFGVLRALARGQDLDIVHLHGHAYLFSFFGALFCSFLKIPYVITHHGEGVPLSWMSRISKFLRDNIQARYVLGHAKKVISVNRYEVKALTQRYKVPPRKIVVIPNGVDENRFHTLQAHKSSLLKEWANKRIILSGGVLAQWKGFDYLIRAMKLIIKEQDDTRLAITGNGPDRARLQNLVVALGLQEHVKFLGYLDDSLMPLCYSLAYVYVLPSIYDVCPTSVLQAMASEKPVIVTSRGGQTELVIDGKTGLIVEPCNAEALAKAILTLLSNEELASSMGKQGRQVILRSFTWHKICEKVLRVYRDVIKSEVKVSNNSQMITQSHN
jgi:glycosyltransferase involved in cell wall biosynthesis